MLVPHCMQLQPRGVNHVQVSTTGCEGGVDAVGQSTKLGVVTGSVNINGSCFYVVTDSGGAFVPVGEVTMGQCVDAVQGGCAIANCGSDDTPAARCNSQVETCTVIHDAYCRATYDVYLGDTCAGIAADQGVGTLEDLLAMNPGLDCEALSIDQLICVSWGQVASVGQVVCEGYQV